MYLKINRKEVAYFSIKKKRQKKCNNQFHKRLHKCSEVKTFNTHTTLTKQKVKVKLKDSLLSKTIKIKT